MRPLLPVTNKDLTDGRKHVWYILGAVNTEVGLEPKAPPLFSRGYLGLHVT